MFTAVENKKISQIVIEQIQDMIMDGRLKAGDRLPPERELTEMFQIGRPALREALKALEVLGLVECRHGLGNYIVNHVENNFFKPLSLAFKLSGGNVREILELRFLIETFAARTAARVSTPEDIAVLRGILESMIKAPTPAEKSSFDQAMHDQIVHMCRNSLILNTYENVSHLMKNFIAQAVDISYFAENDSVEHIYAEHRNIIDAIEKHQEDLAVSYMNIHLGKIDEYRLHSI
ncbi:FadR/GntR family transcriptional regulator [Bacilliculturomica massiliensis]|uniref:FadR/GntR family transcriptional regulator n=1 Tax=Bacilliculturomica massiliensis TaxID=1917867 RepID=UPI001032054F|nr:FadR/GntR family transcriptional regulator [Bacilliculturomica massiliensis]